MLKNIAPLLAVMDVTIVLKQHSDGTDIVALVVPKPRKKAKNEKLNSVPPLIRRGPVEKVEAELNGQALLSKLAEFRDLVANDAAFTNALQEAGEKPSKPQKAPAQVPSKRGAKAAPQEAEKPKDKDVVLLDKTMEGLEQLVKDQKADDAIKKYGACVNLYKTIKERNASLVEGYPDKLRALKDRVNQIQQQTLDL